MRWNIGIGAFLTDDKIEYFSIKSLRVIFWEFDVIIKKIYYLFYVKQVIFGKYIYSLINIYIVYSQCFIVYYKFVYYK